MRDMADEFDGRVIFAKIDAQNSRDLAEQFKIKSIPTLVFFKKGKEWENEWSKESPRVAKDARQAVPLITDPSEARNAVPT